MHLNPSADDILATTRCVRKRLNLDKPVPPEVLVECLEIALQAPPASNSLPRLPMQPGRPDNQPVGITAGFWGLVTAGGLELHARIAFPRTWIGMDDISRRRH